jgi:hypothetical protein
MVALSTPLVAAEVDPTRKPRQDVTPDGLVRTPPDALPPTRNDNAKLPDTKSR